MNVLYIALRYLISSKISFAYIAYMQDGTYSKKASD